MNRRMVWSTMLVLVATVAGCHRHGAKIPSVPVPASCASNKDMDGLSCDLYQWKDGASVMFVDQRVGSYGDGIVKGLSSTDRSEVHEASGNSLHWELTRTAGQAVELTIKNCDTT